MVFCNSVSEHTVTVTDPESIDNHSCTTTLHLYYKLFTMKQQIKQLMHDDHTSHFNTQQVLINIIHDSFLIMSGRHLHDYYEN